MITVHRYRSMPAFFNVLRELARGKSKNKIKFFESDKDCQVGFTNGEEQYCVDISTIRAYYYALYAGVQNFKTDAELYGHDIVEIMGNKGKSRWN